MNQEFYADGISAVHVTGQLVRIDLMSVQPHLKGDNGQPVIEVNKRIIIPLEGFVQSLAVQENIVKQLIAAGVLKETPPVTADDSCLPGKKARTGIPESATNKNIDNLLINAPIK